jgi:hypothetical protein
VLTVSVSVGEVVDKITILSIKRDTIRGVAALKNVSVELKTLQDCLLNSSININQIEAEWASLRAVNQQLWDIEDDIRDLERRQEFGDTFVKVARSVYLLNDERARLKRLINEKTNSGIIEEKSYSAY